MAVPTRAELEAMIGERLTADPEFRTQLLADPRATLSALAGTDIPGRVTITVHEESLTDIHLVIPATTTDEIADADLALVAGGGCWADGCNTIEQ